MKRLFALLFVALFAFACGGSSTPGDVAVELYNLVDAGNYEKAADLIAYEGETSEAIAEQKAMITSLFKEKAGPQLEANGGVKSVEVLGETLSEDGKQADVELKIVYGNDTEETEKVSLVLTDDGWKHSISK